MISINRDKAIATSLERYGVDNPLKSDYAKRRKEEYFMNKYGVDNPWKLDAVQDKCKQTLLERHGVDSPLKLVDWSKIHVTKPHQEIVDYLLELDPLLQLSINDRKLIAPYEIDILISDHRLAIEFNGFFWHSDSSKGNNYHLMKTTACADNGVKLIHIFEDEWVYKKEIVKSRLSYLLNRSKRLFARKCEVREVSPSDATKFLDRCHLQGRCRSSERYGLFYNGELVALMTFGKPRFNKNYEWELLRYCSLPFTNIVGGASKLLSAFRKVHAEPLITYADRRWSDGHLYKSLGFDLVGTSKPSYFYVKSGSDLRINRATAQKHNLAQLLGSEFDVSLSESQNMKTAGYDRIFDCGNFVFEMR
jgi:hypothetical protein